MKTTISIPDELFDRAERFAKLARRSRNEVYSAAVREYIARHGFEDVTEAMNRVWAMVDVTLDSFGRAAARRLLEGEKW